MDARQAERTRTRLLLGGLIGFVIWQGFNLADRAFGASLDRTTRRTLVVASLLGWLGWLYHLVRSNVLNRKVRQTPHLESALNDEFVQTARLKAWRAGLFAVLAAQGVLMVYEGPANIGAQFTVLVGVAASIAGFLFYERA